MLIIVIIVIVVVRGVPVWRWRGQPEWIVVILSVFGRVQLQYGLQAMIVCVLLEWRWPVIIQVMELRKIDDQIRFPGYPIPSHVVMLSQCLGMSIPSFS